jgi:formylglycine-generating enzyme required for sulfatase activity
MLNRADLVYWLKRDTVHAEELEQAAGILGFERKSDNASVISNVSENVIETASTLTGSVSEFDLTSLTIPDARFFCVASRQRLATDLEVSERINEPLSIQGVGDFTEQDLTPASSKPIPLQPLIKWSRLWPVLKKCLHTSHQTALDVPCLIQQLAAGRLMRRLPRLQRLNWASHIEILLDDHTRLIPFQSDFDTVCEALQDLVGRFNLQVWKVTDIGTGDYAPWGQPQQDPKHWNLPLPTTPVLILSDLGLLDTADSVSRRQWLRLGRQLKAVGVMPFVLAPVSPEHIDPEIGSYFHITLWSMNSRLQRQQQRYQQRDQAALQQLLVLLSPAIRIEPALLRALRHCLPADQFDAGCEAQFWSHPDVQVSPLACAIGGDETTLKRYRFAFNDQPEYLQRQVIQLLRQHHARLFPAIHHEETLIWASLVGTDLLEEYQAEIDAAKLFMCKMARMLYQRRDDPDLLQLDYGQRILVRSHSDLRSLHRYYSVVEGVVNRDMLERGMPLREGIDRDELLRTLSSDSQQQRQCILYQQGEELILAEQSTGFNTADIHINSRYVEFALIGDRVIIEQTVQGVPSLERYPAVAELPKTLTMIFPETECIRLQTQTEMITLKALTIPELAETIGRDQQGLFVEFKQRDALLRLYWPEWGGDLGYDDYGLYADLTINDITQRFRWIEPGAFLMGSPDSEPEREPWGEASETLHLVTLTQGYWLADTACTQALWQAVMSDNPAYFKENVNNPVEQISWNDVQEYVECLNVLIPGLTACLPTEAQWEYACRAGTETPFSFGRNITPVQVNYDGNFPYADGEKGQYHKKTVSVKSLPANSWGLYEMHGNVWEWCQDSYSEYSMESITDPIGPLKGVSRVLRGGSWFNDGRDVRSACRGGDGPAERSSIIGFRLALGQAAGIHPG